MSQHFNLSNTELASGHGMPPMKTAQKTILFFFSYFALLPFGMAQDGSKVWELKKTQNSIKVFSRIHKSGYEMTKIMVTLNHSLHALLAINTDHKELKNWMDSAISSELVELLSPTNYVVHMTWDIPAPFQDRDSVARTVITQNPDTKVVLLNYKTENNLVPTSIKYVRMEQALGYWKYTPISKTQTEVEYTSLTMPGGELTPIWANLKAIEAPLNTITNMISILDSGKYNNVHLDYLE